MLVDDSAADPEAKAGAAFSLGGEEGLKEVWLNIGGDAWAIVGYGDDGSGKSSFDQRHRFRGAVS